MNTPYFDLGSYSRSVTTSSPEAQIWFDRGLNWCYGFNQEEAVRCFKQAIELDPDCAMAYWGVAYAAGPFYNKPWEWYGEQERIDAAKFCFDYAQQAWQRRNKVTEVECRLIDALCQKHPADQGGLAEMPQWSHDYANAMRQVYEDFPDDLDAICLTAEALMNLTPWQLWDLQKAEPASAACTEEAIDILQHGVDLIDQQGLNYHPGIVHFYIHVFEMSPTPERALPLANKLRELCPECGHLLHMASHIDALCGQWQQAVTANTRAINADLKYFKLRGTGEFYMISALHNYHFKMYAAMFLGQYEAAMSASNGLRALVSDEILQKIEERYLASTLEAYYSAGIHVLVRFGHWQQITEETLPDNQALYPITTILLHYAKTIAFAALGNIETARKHKSQFEILLANVPDWHIVANNPTVNILKVAEAMMNGELEYHAGKHDLGYEYLRQATELSDRLEYSEPWPWMHPPRHALGALLLEQGHVEEALQHYEDDLGHNNKLPRCVQHRGNIWSLHGYHECLLRLGRNDEADAIKLQLDILMQQTDINITSSCSCRKS